MTPQDLWQQIICNEMPDGDIVVAMQKAVSDLELFTQRPFTLNQMQIKLIPFTNLRTYVNDPLFAAAIFLHMSDDLPGWAVFTLPENRAVRIVDWLLEKPTGTTYDLDPLACSALAEMGNIMLASFLSQLSQFTGVSIRPSPPSVVVDKLATILEIGAVSVSVITDELLVIEAIVENKVEGVQIRTWILPDRFAFQYDQQDIQPYLAELIDSHGK